MSREPQFPPLIDVSNRPLAQVRRDLSASPALARLADRLIRDASDPAAVIAAFGSYAGGGSPGGAEQSGTRSTEQSEVDPQNAAELRRELARQTKRAADAEAARGHESHRPRQLFATDFRVRRNDRTGRDTLFLVFTPERGYRVSGDEVRMTDGGVRSRSPLGLPPFIEARKPVERHLGEQRDDGSWDLPATLHLRFWPPAEGLDPSEPWRCPCGRPAEFTGPPHWEMTVPVPEQGRALD